MKTTAIICIGLFAAAAAAKLPTPSDEAKAKAAETAAKTAWTDKVAAYQLCKAQDKIAAAYVADAKKAGKEVKPIAGTPPCTDPGPFAYTAVASAPAAASAPASSASAASAPKSK